MKMTKEKHLELVAAWWDGNLETLNPDLGKWSAAHACVWAIEDPSRYRIRPQPKLRPWKPEEVPVGYLYRSKEAAKAGLAYRGVITYVDDGGIPRPCGDGFRWLKFDELLQEYEHSLDGGKTWLPCGVEE